MPCREKVIRGLETCRTRVDCKECPYAYDKRANDSYCEAVLHNDVLALLKEREEEIENLKQTCQSMMEGICLLKEQEAVKPIWSCGKPFCGACGLRIHDGKFCSKCGKPILWGER